MNNDSKITALFISILYSADEDALSKFSLSEVFAMSFHHYPSKFDLLSLNKILNRYQYITKAIRNLYILIAYKLHESGSKGYFIILEELLKNHSKLNLIDIQSVRLKYEVNSEFTVSI